jgi:biopolymer transport protein TolR
MAGIIPAAGAVSSGSRFRRRRYTPIADINVTPLVDVMLVLLIIFMVTAPLLQVGVPVDLPKTSAQQVGGKDEPLVVSVNSQGEVFLGETKYELPELATKLKAVHEEKPDQRVFMRGDKAVNYGKMMEVMGGVLLRTLIASSGAKTAGFGVPSFVPKWRPLRDSNPCRRRERAVS